MRSTNDPRAPDGAKGKYKKGNMELAVLIIITLLLVFILFMAIYCWAYWREFIRGRK